MAHLAHRLLELKVTATVMSPISVTMTAFRLWLRRGRYGWDDFWATVSMLWVIIQLAAVWRHTSPGGISRTTRVAAYYVMGIAFCSVLWTARLSILYSIIRIEPESMRRRYLHWVAYAFGFCGVFLIAQFFWVCLPHRAWQTLASPQCHLDPQVAICQITTDVAADIFLCVAPLRILRKIRYRPLRRRLIVIFSACLFTTIASIVHVCYLLATGGIRLLISAMVEVNVALMVANLPVVATFVIHKLSGAEHSYSQEDAQTDASWNQRTPTGYVCSGRTIQFRGDPSASRAATLSIGSDNASSAWASVQLPEVHFGQGSPVPSSIIDAGKSPTLDRPPGIPVIDDNTGRCVTDEVRSDGPDTDCKTDAQGRPVASTITPATQEFEHDTGKAPDGS